MKINPLFLIDFYKADHRRQYPEGTTMVYSNFTPRSNKYAYPDSKEIVVFGIQYFIKEYLINQWNEGFFKQPKDQVVSRYTALMDRALGPGAIESQHIADLHDLGYLPILLKALPEGTLCPIGIPCLTIVNTDPKFFWLTNYLETLLSNILWKPMTSASTAYMYRKEFERHAEKTGSPKDFICWQGHDFSFRGMSGIEDACMSSGGHLISFDGTDTVAAIDWIDQYYHADQFIGGSVPATEHSVMCMGGDGVGEFETFKRLITEIYPKGIVSIVSDTWDFWKVMTEYLPALKDEILARGTIKYDFEISEELTTENLNSIYAKCWTIGKHESIFKIGTRFFQIHDGPEYDSWVELFETPSRVVIRPDSGDPVDIICGEIYDRNLSDYPTEEEIKLVNAFEKFHYESPQGKGAYELLWDTFGGTINEKGYKILNPKVGLIYGDSITYQRQKEILARLEAKGFTASNLVLGIGSFTYEYVTRDTYGFAMKATYGEINYVGKDIYKDPKTDEGLKKSAKNLLQVYQEDGVLKLKDQCTWEEAAMSLLNPVFFNGKLLKEESLETIRQRLYN